MSIFDVFTGAPAKQAAQQNAELFRQYGTQATDALNRGQTGAQNALMTAQGQAIPALTQYGTKAAESYAPLSALGQKYGTATTAALDALGVNGPEAAARARTQFQTGPGYQFQVDEATNAAARKAAALGLGGSGNALDEIRNRAQGVASGEWNTYLQSLLGFTQPELSATGGAASGQAGAYGNLANNLANTYTGTGGSLANLFSTSANNQANVLGNVASGNAQSNQQTAKSQMDANSQFWNTVLGAAGAGAKIFAGGV